MKASEILFYVMLTWYLFSISMWYYHSQHEDTFLCIISFMRQLRSKFKVFYDIIQKYNIQYYNTNRIYSQLFIGTLYCVGTNINVTSLFWNKLHGMCFFFHNLFVAKEANFLQHLNHFLSSCLRA